jgi:hypothetical protein
MIEKFYASHIKTMLDAAAINVRRGTIQRERQAQREAQENNKKSSWKGREGGRKARSKGIDRSTNSRVEAPNFSAKNSLA